MASVTVYLIGPPVLHPADIKDLLQAAIIGQLGREFRGFTIREMRGPVQFKSFWILESGVRHARRRPGLQSVDLWCVVCVWPPASLDQSPWSIIVYDSEKERGNPPLIDAVIYDSDRRTSFRAMPAGTIPVYGVQDNPYDAVIADMQRPPNSSKDKHWLACYVMMSRARSLDGFLVLRPAMHEELSVRPPQYRPDELRRMEQLGFESIPELIQYIDSSSYDVPAACRRSLEPEAVVEESRRVKELRGSSTACDLPMPQKRPRRKTPFPAGASTWLLSSFTT